VRKWHTLKLLTLCRKDWYCGRCQKKKSAASAEMAPPKPSAAVISSPNIPPDSPKEPKAMTKGYPCEVKDCNAFILQLTSNGKSLCKKHEIEDRHKNAKAQKPVLPPIGKPISKKRLYTYKPDEEMKKQKQKRPSESRRSTSFNNPGISANDSVESGQRNFQQRVARGPVLAEPLPSLGIIHATKPPEWKSSLFSKPAGQTPKGSRSGIAVPAVQEVNDETPFSAAAPNLDNNNIS